MLASKLLRRTVRTNVSRLSARLNVTRIAPSKYYGYGSGLNIDYEEGPLSKEKMKGIIKKDRSFCGNEQSITRNDLASYINGNTTIYNYKSGLGGVMVVGGRRAKPDKNYLYIYGICVPPKYKGVGRKLMQIAKDIARRNDLSSLRLEFYG